MSIVDENSTSNLALQPPFAEKRAPQIGRRDALVDVQNVARTRAQSKRLQLQRSTTSLQSAASAFAHAPLGAHPIDPAQTAALSAVIGVSHRLAISSGGLEIDEDCCHLPAPVRPMGVENIDEFDNDDPQFCTDYVLEIFDYLRVKELRSGIDSTYMGRQGEINEKMRATLVDWMAEIHVKFKLLSETLFLSVYLVDAYLSKKPVARNELQLLGITAMLIASKYEEILAVEIGDFVFICDHAYSKERIIQFESEVLNTLRFNLLKPSPLDFLRRFSKAARADARTHTMSKYLVELSLLDYRLLAFPASQIAAAAAYLSRRMLHLGPYWTPTVAYYSKYSESDIVTPARVLNELVRKLGDVKCSTRALWKKYASPKLMEMSNVEPAVDF